MLTTPAKNGAQSPSVEPLAEPRIVGGIALYHNLEEDFSVYPLAPVKLRFFAGFLDVLFCGLLTDFIHMPFEPIVARLRSHDRWLMMILLFFFTYSIAQCLYNVFPTYFWGKSLGKVFFGLRVVSRTNSSRLSLRQVFLREWLGKFLSLWLGFYGFIQILLREDRLALHDVLGSTKVIVYKKETE